MTTENPFVKKQDTTEPEKTEQSKKDRKPITPSFELVLAAVERGEYDKRLIDLMTAVNGRKSALQEIVMQQVHEVFGPNVEIVTKRASSSPPASTPRAVVVEEAEDAPAPDPLSHLDSVEQAMATEVGSPAPAQAVASPPPIEQRGASISGLHSSGIA